MKLIKLYFCLFSLHKISTHAPLDHTLVPLMTSSILKPMGNFENPTCAEGWDLANNTEISAILSNGSEKVKKIMSLRPEDSDENLTLLLTCTSFEIISRSSELSRKHFFFFARCWLENGFTSVYLPLLTNLPERWRNTLK